MQRAHKGNARMWTKSFSNTSTSTGGKKQLYTFWDRRILSSTTTGNFQISKTSRLENTSLFDVSSDADGPELHRLCQAWALLCCDDARLHWDDFREGRGELLRIANHHCLPDRAVVVIAGMREIPSHLARNVKDVLPHIVSKPSFKCIIPHGFHAKHGLGQAWETRGACV